MSWKLVFCWLHLSLCIVILDVCATSPSLKSMGPQGRTIMAFVCSQTRAPTKALL